MINAGRNQPLDTLLKGSPRLAKARAALPAQLSIVDSVLNLISLLDDALHGGIQFGGCLSTRQQQGKGSRIAFAARLNWMETLCD